MFLQPNNSINFWERRYNKIVFLLIRKKKTGEIIDRRGYIWQLMGSMMTSYILLQRGMNIIMRQVQGAFFP